MRLSEAVKREKAYGKTIENLGLNNALSEGSANNEQSFKSIWDLDGKVVVIAEKPKAARKIVEAVFQEYKPRVLRYKGIPYWVINTKWSEITVVSAAGHLYGITTTDKGYPTFNYTWQPIHIVEKGAEYAKNYITLIDKVCKGANHYVNACDYDIEGSVIGYLIIKNHGDVNRSLRAKFSSLTPRELRNAFSKLMPLDKEMIEAGLCRHELDWIWGINVSRALMNSLMESAGRSMTLSAGRVQTPTLKYVVDKVTSRNLFIPIPQYSISVTVRIGGSNYSLEYCGRSIESREEADSIAKAIKTVNKLTVVDYKEEVRSIPTPPPFNLSDLQSEAARVYGLSPLTTQKVAEALYLDALISYPRTNSQKLPKDLNYEEILKSISSIPQYRGLVNKLFSEVKGVLKPVEGAKDDPAHPAIYPTGVAPVGLNKISLKVYDLITKRFIASFAPSGKVLRKTIVLSSSRRDEGDLFKLAGQEIIYEGWLKYYPFSMPKEFPIPRVSVGELLEVVSVKVDRKFSKPPELPSKIKVLKWMESVSIGTESTRARIIETLFARKYVVGDSRGINATDLGIAVVEILSDYFSELTEVSLTRSFEKKLEAIKRGLASRNQVVSEAREILVNLLNKFTEKKTEIGISLAKATGLLKPKAKCIACHREAFNENLCKYHYLALQELWRTYHEWQRREGVSTEEYLNDISKLKSAGRWVKELIEVLYIGRSRGSKFSIQ